MPTYADEMADRNPRKGHAGPVRIWISSGEMVRDSTGRMRLTERWEEEEIMDTDVISSLDSDFEALPSSHDGGSLAGLISSNLRRSTGGTQKPHGGSLLVLDTNTLLSALPACMAIFTQCLARNTFALESDAFIASPIMLIVPYVVVRELDGLKSSNRLDRGDVGLTVGQKAQRANRWILDAIQQQKRRSYVQSGSSVSASLPEHAWVLHLENSAFYQTSRADPTYREETPDDEIISHCRFLQRDTHQTVWLCSDDINAKLRAESDAILTFSIADWVRETVGLLRGDRDDRLSSAVSDLIDQWSGQMGVQHGVRQDGESAMEQDPPMSAISGGGIGDSLHAPRDDGLAVKRAINGHRYGTRSRTFNRTPNTQQHAYTSADRSSASSMWANR